MVLSRLKDYAMNNVTIRSASKADLPSILNLYTVFEKDKANILSVEKAEKIFDIINSYPNYCFYVAEYNKIVIGTFSLLIIDNLIHHGAPSAIIDAVVVDPAFQGRGLGAKMMRKAMEISVKHGCFKLALSSNFQWGVHDFYKTLGFKQHGMSFHVELE